MIDTSISKNLIVPGLVDCEGVPVRNHDIIRVVGKDRKRYRHGEVGYGFYIDDNTLEQHIGFFIKYEGHTVSIGQICGYSKDFKVVGNSNAYR